MEQVDYHVASGASRRMPRRRCASRAASWHQGQPADPGDRAQYSLEQGLTPRLMRLDELFAKSAMDQ